MEPHQPPGKASEAAIRAAAQAAGLAVAPHELRPLLKALGGRPPASDQALRAALLGIRRRAWRDRLAALAKGAEALPARPDDLHAAIASIGGPEAGDAALLGALREAVLARLAGDGAPDTALAAALEDLPKGVSGQPALAAVEHCAMLVAEAFALPGADAAAFARRAAEAERRRRGERRAAARAARETRAEEERRLKAWEASLVGAEAVPGLLGCGR
ncbi:MAG: RNA helicase, partial [Acetobacteraceae bacterium]|nr:RNA helicase [Acetobacteraceae bacterium]